MPVARLVAAALVLCSSLAFSQTVPSHPDFDAAVKPDSNLLAQLLPGMHTPDTMFAEPWQIMRAQQAESNTPSQKTLNDQAKANAMAEQAARLLASIPYDPNSQRPRFKFSPDGKLLGWGVDESCFSIRSFQVERDSKDSDATHLVRSSTCQPASRFGVKTAVMTQGHSDQ
jgi:hypothetical protein